MDHFQVKVGEVDEPTALLAVKDLGGMKVDEVFVVSEDLDGKRGAVEVL